MLSLPPEDNSTTLKAAGVLAESWAGLRLATRSSSSSKTQLVTVLRNVLQVAVLLLCFARRSPAWPACMDALTRMLYFAGLQLGFSQLFCKYTFLN